jgi:hypothetical protein
MPIGPYTNLTLLGSFIWCLVFAGIGWAIGNSYERFNTAFDYVSIAFVALVVAGIITRRLRRRAVRKNRADGDQPQDGRDLNLRVSGRAASYRFVRVRSKSSTGP